MSRGKPYPLEAVETVRGAAVREAEARLRDAEARAEAARAELARRRDEAARHRAETEALRGREATRDRAPRAAVDLARASTFFEARRAPQRDLDAAAEEAAHAVTVAESAVEGARAELVEARQAERVVETHRERWAEGERQRALAHEERELDEHGRGRAMRRP